jgi:hypothetical protein
MILFVLKKKLMKKRVLKDLGGFWRFWFLLWDFALVSGFWWASGPILEKFSV